MTETAADKFRYEIDHQPGNQDVVNFVGPLTDQAHEVFHAMAQLAKRAGTTILIDLSKVTELSAPCASRLGDLTAYENLKLIAAGEVAQTLLATHTTIYPSLKSAQLAILGEQTTKLIMRNISDLPALNTEIYQVLQTMAKPDVDFAKIEQALAKNSGISAQVLRIANSAFFFRGQKIETLGKAIGRLGIEGVRQILIFDLYNNVRIGLKMTRDVFLHGRRCAELAHFIASEAKPGADVLNKVKLSGLLHDIGSQVLASFMPEQYKKVQALVKEKKVPTYVAELLTFGIEHQTLGKMLAQKWHFPDYLASVIGDHHHLKGTNWDKVTLPVACANDFICELDGLPFGPYYQRLTGYFMLFKADLPWDGDKMSHAFKTVIAKVDAEDPEKIF